MNANLEHPDSPEALSGRLPAMTSGFVSKKGAFALAHILMVLAKAALTQVNLDAGQDSPTRREITATACLVAISDRYLS
jgi:hypothetical protein